MNKFYFLFNTIIGDYMELKDIMCKNLVVCDVNDDISFISGKMRDNDVGFVPVVLKNRVVGIITDRDIACRIFNNDDFSGSITDYMSRDVVSVDVNGSISDVLDLMKKNRIKRVIVTDSGRVVGVISISDLICIDDVKDQLYDTIKSIWKIGPNKHKYETFIDEFYL